MLPKRIFIGYDDSTLIFYNPKTKEITQAVDTKVHNDKIKLGVIWGFTLLLVPLAYFFVHFYMSQLRYMGLIAQSWLYYLVYGIWIVSGIIYLLWATRYYRRPKESGREDQLQVAVPTNARIILVKNGIVKIRHLFYSILYMILIFLITLVVVSFSMWALWFDVRHHADIATLGVIIMSFFGLLLAYVINLFFINNPFRWYKTIYQLQKDPKYRPNIEK